MLAIGSDDAMKFHQTTGYLLFTKCSLPIEQAIMVMIGDLGSGRDTHLAAVQGDFGLRRIDPIRQGRHSQAGRPQGALFETAPPGQACIY